jgi:hypothetical protein
MIAWVKSPYCHIILFIGLEKIKLLKTIERIPAFPLSAYEEHQYFHLKN